MLVSLLVSLFAASVNAQCGNLGNWNPVSSLMQYNSAAGSAVTGNTFLTCLVAQNWIPQCTRLSAPNGQFALVLQPDGNAVIYNVWYQSTCNYNQGCVSSTWSASGTLLCMQNDGNLVVYDGNSVVWALNR
ncbi:hypothetical protein BCR33DRAFT_726568 [Rhizoclosmatium globosum]|uniref:Bulb-type lectin domain-containing protein n=1 Tax=Rhizoclosmatium globosum TaxID=329046 RepID=A0A1Y2AU58_9FUNG|nr:hypothetical protein BCR33DRAFT_726568 [Rhizoclosmatium globosum]|eukprot:ORY26016.1 hypothetical protein BCR33DRAFT_726568 [Rhizoclosmatium globosum]